jgi:hypothetical protein
MVIAQEATGLDVAKLIEDIYRDGIVSLPNILPVSWADQLDEDLGQHFLQALKVDRGEGVAFRGWSRYYIELFPERISGFLEWITNPAIVALNRQMLGENYEIVELGADIPLPGAPEQPPHRDFPLPEPTRLHRRLTSLAYNASSVDVTPEMGPFNVAPGTHFDDGTEFKEGMFPVGELRAKYIERMVPRLAKRGSVSARSGLTLHRGTLNNGRLRPVAILGVVSQEDRAHSKTTVELLPGYVAPTLKMSRQYFDSLPDEIKVHIRCEVVAETDRDLPALKTHHGIEGLMMGKAPM